MYDITASRLLTYNLEFIIGCNELLALALKNHIPRSRTNIRQKIYGVKTEAESHGPRGLSHGAPLDRSFSHYFSSFWLRLFFRCLASAYIQGFWPWLASVCNFCFFVESLCVSHGHLWLMGDCCNLCELLLCKARHNKRIA